MRAALAALILVFIFGVVYDIEAATPNVIIPKKADPAADSKNIGIDNKPNDMNDLGLHCYGIIIPVCHRDFIQKFAIEPLPNGQGEVICSAKFGVESLYPIDRANLAQQEDRRIPTTTYGFRFANIDQSKLYSAILSVNKSYVKTPKRKLWAMRSKIFLTGEPVLLLNQIYLATYQGNLSFSSAPQLLSGLVEANSGDLQLPSEKSDGQSEQDDKKGLEAMDEMGDSEPSINEQIMFGALIYALAVLFLIAIVPRDKP